VINRIGLARAAGVVCPGDCAARTVSAMAAE
jgi:hypothetical protein